MLVVEFEIVSEREERGLTGQEISLRQEESHL